MDVTHAWLSLRRMPKVEPDAMYEDDPDVVELPLFQSEWQAEFDETQIHAIQFKLLAAFVGIPVVGVTCYYLYMDPWIQQGGSEWVVLQWSGYCLVAIISLLTIFIYTAHWAPVQRFSISHFEGLAGTAIVLTFAGVFDLSFLPSRGASARCGLIVLTSSLACQEKQPCACSSLNTDAIWLGRFLLDNCHGGIETSNLQLKTSFQQPHVQLGQVQCYSHRRMC